MIFSIKILTLGVEYDNWIMLLVFIVPAVVSFPSGSGLLEDPLNNPIDFDEAEFINS